MGLRLLCAISTYHFNFLLIIPLFHLKLEVYAYKLVPASFICSNLTCDVYTPPTGLHSRRAYRSTKAVFHPSNELSKGLVNTIAKVFPCSSHAYCLRHLEENFMKRNVRLEKALKECRPVFVRIAYAYTVKDYDDAVNDLLATSMDTHHWLLQKSDAHTGRTIC